MFIDETWFDQDDLYNRQNGCVYAESREASSEDFDTIHVHNFSFEVMVSVGITFNGVTGVVISPQIISHLIIYTTSLKN